MVKVRISRTRWSLIILPALMYNIWPLAYWLDPSALKNNYLSVLEVAGRPYSWLFILGDVITSLLVIFMAINLIRIFYDYKNIIFGYLAFGVFTLLEALTQISNKCQKSISACGISPVQIFSVHDLASVGAALGILYGVYMSLRLIKSINLTFYKIARYIFWFWSLSGISLVLSVAFDSATLLSQAMFLIMCGVALVEMPLSVYLIRDAKQAS